MVSRVKCLGHSSSRGGAGTDRRIHGGCPVLIARRGDEGGEQVDTALAIRDSCWDALHLTAVSADVSRLVEPIVDARGPKNDLWLHALLRVVSS